MSSRTPKRNSAKTGLARKFLLLGLVVGLLVYLAVIIQAVQSTTPYVSVCSGSSPCPKFLWRAEVVSSQALLSRGLSGRKGLPPQQAMLFDFTDEDKHCIWMKDMRFAIDVVWLGSNNRVVAVKEFLTPASYPKQFCGQRARYVLELPAGDVMRNHVSIGSTLSF